MSYSQSAMLNRADVPTRTALQEAIKALKFKLAIDEAYVPFVSSGFLPCTINGEDGGFDIRFDALAPYLQQYPQLQAQANGRDTLITLTCGGDPREEVCALMVAAALAQKFGAIIHRPKQDQTYSAEQLINLARSKFDLLE